MTRPKIRQPTCPLCGELPRMMMTATQALCAAPECAAFMWNPTKSAPENLTDTHIVDLLDLPGPRILVRTVRSVSVERPDLSRAQVRDMIRELHRRLREHVTGPVRPLGSDR